MRRTGMLFSSRPSSPNRKKITREAFFCARSPIPHTGTRSSPWVHWPETSGDHGVSTCCVYSHAQMVFTNSLLVFVPQRYSVEMTKSLHGHYRRLDWILDIYWIDSLQTFLKSSWWRHWRSREPCSDRKYSVADGWKAGASDDTGWWRGRKKRRRALSSDDWWNSSEGRRRIVRCRHIQNRTASLNSTRCGSTFIVSPVQW